MCRQVLSFGKNIFQTFWSAYRKTFEYIFIEVLSKFWEVFEENLRRIKEVLRKIKFWKKNLRIKKGP